MKSNDFIFEDFKLIFGILSKHILMINFGKRQVFNFNRATLQSSELIAPQSDNLHSLYTIEYSVRVTGTDFDETNIFSFELQMQRMADNTDNFQIVFMNNYNAIGLMTKFNYQDLLKYKLEKS